MINVPKKVVEKFALVPPQYYTTLLVSSNPEQFPQFTKQDVEDLDQVLKLEHEDLFKMPIQEMKKYSKEYSTKGISKPRHTPIVPMRRGMQFRTYEPKPYRIHSGFINQKLKVPGRSILSRNLNYASGASLRRAEVVIDDSEARDVLPEISDSYGISRKAEFANRNYKSSRRVGSIANPGTKRIPIRIRRKIEKLDQTFSFLNKELQMEDYKEKERRRAMHKRNRSDQLQRTEMLLRNIVLDKPKFIDHLHEYRQQLVTRFMEDRKNIKDRLYKLLASPDREVAKLERQGQIRKIVLSKRKSKSYSNSN